MEDLAREMAVAVLPKVLRQAALLHAVPDFQLKEDEAAARQRTALCQRADSLFKAIHQAQELQTKAAAGAVLCSASCLASCTMLVHVLHPCSKFNRACILACCETGKTFPASSTVSMSVAPGGSCTA